MTATGNVNGVLVAWSANVEPDLAGYNVYRSASAGGAYSKLNGALLSKSVLSFGDTTVASGATVWYRVTAVDMSGNESAATQVSGTRTASNGTPPAAPASLTATGTKSAVILGWRANTEANLAGYNVYRSSASGGPFVKLNSAVLTGASFSDPSAPVGVTAYYHVTAVDTSGNESAASSASASRLASDSTPPATPAGLTAKPSGAAVSLTWSANSEADLAGYNIYRSSTSGGTYVKLNTSGLLPSPSYLDSTLAAGATGYYLVTAVDSSGNESAGATATITRPITGTGLLGQYYSDQSFTTLKLTQVDPRIAFYWGSNPPAPSMPASNFSVRWTGQVLAQTTEAYTFTLRAHDGARLWINGQLVIDHFTTSSTMIDNVSAPIMLQAGHRYDIRVDYYETTGRSGCELYWQTASIAKGTIPSADLYPPGT